MNMSVFASQGEIAPSYELAMIITKRPKKLTVPYIFSINLLAFYHKWRALIGYATHYLFCDRQRVV